MVQQRVAMTAMAKNPPFSRPAKRAASGPIRGRDPLSGRFSAAPCRERLIAG